MTLTPKQSLLVGVAAIGVLFGGLRYGASHGYLPSSIGKVLIAKSSELPSLEDAQVPNVKPAEYPSSSPAHVSATKIRAEVWEWNAQMPLLLANGGADTTKGSMMEAHKVNLHIERQDDTNKMVAEMVSCAKEIHDGATQCTSGANFVVIMGDQSAEVAAQADPLLKKIGADYGLKIIYALGYSRGEDACMTPKSYADDPKSIAQTSMFTLDGTELPIHGLLIAASIHEGDWDICAKHAGDNAIPMNAGTDTFDADAVNFMSEPDYNTAAADYVAGKCEDRREAVKGKLTGKMVHVCLNGAAVWTPADVTVAMQRGGLVKAADSLMYRSMMPAVIIGPSHFLTANRTEIEGMLAASSEAADQIKAYDGALHKAAEISSKVYADEGADGYHHGDYWAHYFKPVKQLDKQKQMVSLGGSAVNNLADNLILFGFNGNNNNMVATFDIFRGVNLQLFPDQYNESGPTPLPTSKETIDYSFIKDLKNAADDPSDASATGTAAADVVDYSKSGSGDVVSHRAYSITFATGSDQPLPDGETVLRQVLNDIAITGLKVKIDGYTDSTGNAASNVTLSQARAEEVKTWLRSHDSHNFPNNRFVGVEGHGSAKQLKDNASSRRVEITMER